MSYLEGQAQLHQRRTRLWPSLALTAIAALGAAAIILVTVTVAKGDTFVWALSAPFKGPIIGNGAMRGSQPFPSEAACRAVIGTPGELEARRHAGVVLRLHDPDATLGEPTCEQVELVVPGTPI